MVGSKKMGGAGACQHVGIVVSVRIIGSQVLAEDGQKYQENNYDKTGDCGFSFHEFFDKFFGFAALVSNDSFVDKIFLKGKFFAVLFVCCV